MIPSVMEQGREGAGGLAGGIPRWQQGGDTAWALGAANSKHQLCPAGTCICLTNTLTCNLQAQKTLSAASYGVAAQGAPGNHPYTQQEAVAAGSTLVNWDLTERHVCAAGTGNCPQNERQISEPSLSPTPSSECTHNLLTHCVSLSTKLLPGITGYAESALGWSQ